MKNPKNKKKKLRLRKPVKYALIIMLFILVFFSGKLLPDKIELGGFSKLMSFSSNGADIGDIFEIYNDSERGIPSLIKQDAYGNLYFSDTSNSWLGVKANSYLHGMYGWRPFLSSEYRDIDENSIDYFFGAQSTEDNEYSVKGTFPIYVKRNSPTTSLSEKGYWFEYHNNIHPDSPVPLLGCEGLGYDINVDAQYLTIISAADHLLFERDLDKIAEWYPKILLALEGLDRYASSNLGCFKGVRQKYKGIPISSVQGSVVEYGQNNNQFRSSTLIYTIATYDRLIELTKLNGDEDNNVYFSKRKAELESSLDEFNPKGWFIGGKAYTFKEYLDNYENTEKFVADSENNGGCRWVEGASGSLTCENAEVIYTFNFENPVDAVSFESASEELGENLFYADGQNQTLTVQYSNDKTNWQSAYTYVWTEPKGIRPVITMPAELKGSTTLYLKIIAQSIPGSGIQWYSTKVKSNSQNMKIFGNGELNDYNGSYFESYPNVDSIMLDVVRENKANSILEKIEEIPELTENSPLLINFPVRPYEEMTNKIIPGSDINAGWWWTTASGALYSYFKQEHKQAIKYLDQLLNERKKHHSKNNYDEFGADKEPFDFATLGEIGAFGAALRAMLDIQPKADTLLISPHILDEIKEFDLPILWGDKKIFLELNGMGDIESVQLNGAEKEYDSDTQKIEIAFSDLAETNNLVINLN
ncbi:hypothetical protein GF361_04080 [Candidatus Woesearchaeota archaeon]|nr:hypothetical protein [Candidatus Woesearchaeota archaeon]